MLINCLWWKGGLTYNAYVSVIVIFFNKNTLSKPLIECVNDYTRGYGLISDFVFEFKVQI